MLTINFNNCTIGEVNIMSHASTAPGGEPAFQATGDTTQSFSFFDGPLTLSGTCRLVATRFGSIITGFILITLDAGSSKLSGGVRLIFDTTSTYFDSTSPVTTQLVNRVTAGPNVDADLQIESNDGIYFNLKNAGVPTVAQITYACDASWPNNS